MNEIRMKVKNDPREQIFLEMISILWQFDGEGMKRIADEANVHWTTVYNWRNAVVMTPRLDKLVAVALVLGYEVVLKPIDERPRRTKKPMLKAVK